MTTDLERAAIAVADYFRDKPDAIDGRRSEDTSAVYANSPTVLGYIDVGETDCAEIVRAVVKALRSPSDDLLREVVVQSANLGEGLVEAGEAWRSVLSEIEVPSDE